MNDIVAQLGQLGPSEAIALAVAGLVCGLAGWRIVPCLAVANAMAVGALLGSSIQAGLDGAWLPVIPAVVFAATLGYVACRFPRAATSAMTAAAGMLIFQLPLADCDAPWSIHLLLGALGCGLALAMHATLRRETAVVVTSLQGGWLCAAAIVATSSDPQSFGALLTGAISVHAFLFPMVATVFSFMLAALQLTDMEQVAGLWTDR